MNDESMKECYTLIHDKIHKCANCIPTVQLIAGQKLLMPGLFINLLTDLFVGLKRELSAQA